VKLLLSIIVIFLFVGEVSGQNDTSLHGNDSLPESFYLLQKIERDGVDMPEIAIKGVTVVARPRPSRRGEYRKYKRLITNIKRVYPYSLMVRERLDQVNEELKILKSVKERKDYIKNVEKDVFGEYESDMRQMTITQGRLLIKLIDRETQNTSYSLIKEYRGWFTAAFWQSIARIFGTNLKDQYDRFGEDALIEIIIMDIDAGRL
jgi:Domain of unknown function (DUF4294)